MKKFIIIGILITASILCIAAIVFWNSKSASAPENNSSTSSSEGSVQSDSDTPTTATSSPDTKGSYIDYSDKAIANTSGTKLLFFHAPWCPQCRALDKSIVAGPIPDGVTIIKVDYDSNQSLRKKYGVTLQTTLVRVDDSGNLIKKYVAYESPNLSAVIKNAL